MKKFLFFIISLLLITLQFSAEVFAQPQITTVAENVGTVWQNNFTESYQSKFVMTSIGDMWITYSKNIDGYYQNYLLHSEDNGISWTERSLHDYNPNHQLLPVILIDNDDNIHVSWSGMG